MNKLDLLKRHMDQSTQNFLIRWFRRVLCFVLLFSLFFVAVGCNSKHRTEILLRIDTDLTIPDKLDSIHIGLFYQSAVNWEQTFELSTKKSDNGTITLPGTLTVIAGDDPTDPVLIKIIGIHKNDEIVIRQAKVSFIAEKTLVLQMNLLEKCAHNNIICQGYFTCAETGCVSIDVNPSSLPEYGPDSGVSEQDLGQDTNEDASGDMRGDTAEDLQATVKVLDPEGIALTSNEHFDVVNPSVTHTGYHFISIWETNMQDDGAMIKGARIDTDGEIPTWYTMSNELFVSREPSIACNTKPLSCVSVWTNWTEIETSPIGDIRARLMIFAPDPTFQDILPDGVNASIKSTPVVIFDGSNYLIAWSDTSNGDANHDIFAIRVSPDDGANLDNSPIPITTDANNQIEPAIGCQHSEGICFIVWEDYRTGNNEPGVYAARMGANGEVHDPSGIEITSHETEESSAVEPSVACGDTECLVVWTNKEGPSPADHSIYGKRIFTDGSLLDPSNVPIATENFDEHFAEVTFHNGQYLVLWATESPVGIYGARVNTSGVALDSPGFAVSTFPQTDAKNISLSCMQTMCLVVWQSQLTEISTWNIYGSRLSFPPPDVE